MRAPPIARSGLGRGHAGSFGSCRRCWVQSRYPTGARAMGVPGWPELAFWTASIDSTRTASMQRRSSAGERPVGDSDIRFAPLRWVQA
jgi:hypothetical protein